MGRAVLVPLLQFGPPVWRVLQLSCGCDWSRPCWRNAGIVRVTPTMPTTVSAANASSPGCI